MKEWLISWDVKLGKSSSYGSAIVEADSKEEALTKYIEDSTRKLELIHRGATITAWRSLE